ncbi:MAG: hypothetical protein A2Y40_05200 [Candidatus Margulisbacteria bacterium GWF2_35_9]|nr:MAG: hypothetical protein A2Y40_05200 [Candidatus Margulisbacteria bacterium GWF2_35_9]
MRKQKELKKDPLVNSVIIENQDVQILTKKGDAMSVSAFFDIFKHVENSKKNKKKIEKEIFNLSRIRSQMKRKLHVYKKKKIEDLKRIRGKEELILSAIDQTFREIKDIAANRIDEFMLEKGNLIDTRFLSAEKNLNEIVFEEIHRNNRILDDAVQSIKEMETSTCLNLENKSNQTIMAVNLKVNEIKKQAMEDIHSEMDSKISSMLETITVDLNSKINMAEEKQVEFNQRLLLQWQDVKKQSDENQNKLKDGLITKQIFESFREEMETRNNQGFNDITRDVKSKVMEVDGSLLEINQRSIDQRQELEHLSYNIEKKVIEQQQSITIDINNRISEIEKSMKEMNQKNTEQILDASRESVNTKLQLESLVQKQINNFFVKIKKDMEIIENKYVDRVQSLQNSEKDSTISDLKNEIELMKQQQKDNYRKLQIETEIDKKKMMEAIQLHISAKKSSTQRIEELNKAEQSEIINGIKQELLSEIVENKRKIDIIVKYLKEIRKK